ncbi:MAG TPA: hypothetical protein DHM37_09470 [Candidatus Cloacimonas sp.]|jgi:energy-coupling factor transporter ATP-binding protein EcfA2|nr:energy-coupling factor transport system ATP-binding protein [Candidatus Cloacimonadota bacterium]HCX73934.1 hypothetical protein [Candidatus Cloacimonas sp.]
MLKLVDVSFAFGKNQLLHHLDLQLLPGEAVWLQGPNASGKTTLLNIIATIIPRFIHGNFSGQVFWQDTNLHELNFPQIATVLGFLRQHPQQQLFFPKVEQELAFGPENLRKPAEEILATMEEVCNQLQINSLLQVETAKLSFGQKKLVALAANLMLKAPILLLDEPAVGISTNNLHLIKQVLLKEKERGKILVIADHLPVWYDLADRILPMSELR